MTAHPEFFTPAKIQETYETALEDPMTWLTTGYSCALHARYLLEKLRSFGWNGDRDDEIARETLLADQPIDRRSALRREPTCEEIARLAGTSMSTVSRFRRGLSVSEEKRAAVECALASLQRVAA